MAGAMIGANTELLREVGAQFHTRADTVRAAESTTAPEVSSVRWEGPDAERFKADYSSSLSPMLKHLAEKLESTHADLEKQASDQDTCSDGKGGGHGTGGPGQAGEGGKPGDPGYQKPWWRKLWQGYKNVLNIFKGPRFLMELGAALSMRSTFGKFLTTSWAGITGFRPGMASRKLAGIEKQLDDIIGRPYKFLKDMGDLLQGKPLSLKLESALAKFGDSALGREAYRIFEAGKDGTRVLHGSHTMDDILKFAGKEGRLLGKGLGVVGVGMDAFDMVGYAQHGQTGMAVYSGVKAGLGMAAFIPGPVGWAAGGASLALAAYDNIPVVHNAVNAVGSAIADTAKKLWPF